MKRGLHRQKKGIQKRMDYIWREIIWKGNNNEKRLHGWGTKYIGKVSNRKRDYTEKRLYKEKIRWGEGIYRKETYVERRLVTRGENYTGRELHGEKTTRGKGTTRGGNKTGEERIHMRERIYIGRGTIQRERGKVENVNE